VARGITKSGGDFFVITRRASAERRRTHAKRRQRQNEPQRSRVRLHVRVRSRGTDRSAHASPGHESGVVLPIVLLISAMMLATSAVWFKTSLAAARSATNVRDYLQAFHAADSALNLCARSVIAAGADAAAAPAQSRRSRNGPARRVRRNV
jgi:hypothetical protein